MKKNQLLILLFFLISIIFHSCAPSIRFTSDKEETEYDRSEEISDLNEEFSESSSILETNSGTASYYADKFHGRTTASGETYDMYALTAAHPTYPFDTIVRITNLGNNKTILLRINDRMPSFKGRVIDLSLKAAQELDMINSGIAEVKIEVLKWGDG